jgi:CBS domain-containing protein
VRDVMVTDVVTIEPAATLVDAARMMEQSNVGMLPVRDDGELRGVITDRDIVVRAVVRNVDASTTPVGDCLTPDLVLAHPDWTTEQAIRAMTHAQIGRLPVVDDDDRLVGVVTLSSLALRAPQMSETLDAAREVSRRSARAS